MAFLGEISYLIYFYYGPTVSRDELLARSVFSRYQPIFSELALSPQATLQMSQTHFGAFYCCPGIVDQL